MIDIAFIKEKKKKNRWGRDKGVRRSKVRFWGEGKNVKRPAESAYPFLRKYPILYSITMQHLWS